MKLWQKEKSLNKRIETFTIDKDRELDQLLLPFDCQASVAHVTMLGNQGIITGEEAGILAEALKMLADKVAGNTFTITPEDEDGHSAIERYLTEKLGDTGKKVHTGRSRNDQVLTAMRLYERDRMEQMVLVLGELRSAFLTFGHQYHGVPMPGFTHTRKAMPYRVDHWIETFAKAFEDDLMLIESTRNVINQNPLGSGAGYGVPFPLDREGTTNELRFDRVMTPDSYAQHSRGKFESRLLHDCLMILFDLNRWAGDVILFSLPEFGYFVLDDSTVTGSSIMPHKKNPDVLELIRAAYHRVHGYESTTRNLAANLISGYHRDLQYSKEPVISGLELTLEVIAVSKILIEKLQADPEALKRGMSAELNSVSLIRDLVDQGVPFRDAYHQVSKKYKS